MYKNINKNIFHNNLLLLIYFTNLRGKYTKINFLTHFFHEQNLYTSYRLFLCIEPHLF